MFNESWNKTLKIIEDAKGKSINPLYVAIALARTEKLHSQPSTTQKPISDFLEKEFINQFEDVPDSLVFDIGTAIEKAGRRIDILKYYELAKKRFVDNADTDNEQICVERWILAKEMQAKHSKNKEEVRRTQEAAEKRKEYEIEGTIEDFITLDGKSSVIKYIIDNEKNQTSDSIKPKVIIVKKRPESQSSKKEEAYRNVKQKVEFDLEGYRLVYFTETRRLNIASNSDGRIISLLHSTEKNNCFSTHDYVIIDDFTDDIGDCQRIEGTTICFCITDKEIIVLFENTKIVMKFL